LTGWKRILRDLGMECVRDLPLLQEGTDCLTPYVGMERDVYGADQ
jgi:hypothetical protein